uniref:Uncharacterized protein n=1 Tax=Magallana gigas TaxID=29159 RepID=A0A8W8M7B5_MAGGI|nr:uncharacterized protein LOC105335643 isoform X1 [Crassostrea gigas]
MISPDLKDLFQSVESAFCVPEDTEQLSFAANLLKSVDSEKIASEIKLLSDRLEFLDCSKVFGNEDPGTVCALDVDIVFNKDHLGVEKRDPYQWKDQSLLKSEKIMKVILVHSKSLRVVETKLRVYKEYEMLFRSKTLQLQHEYEDFDEIAKKSANAKVSLFQRIIHSLLESIPSKKLANIVSKAAEHSFTQFNFRDICYNEFIIDREDVGTVYNNSYICRFFLTVRRIKRRLVRSALRKICKLLGFKICKDIMLDIEFAMGTMHMSEDQRQLRIDISDTFIETLTFEITSFLISLYDPIDSASFPAGSFFEYLFNSVDVNSSTWRRKVAEETYMMVSKHQEDIVRKLLLLVEHMCKKTTEDIKYVSRSLQKWKEKTECMDMVELVSIWEKREAMKNLSGLGSHKSVLNLIAGLKNDNQILKVFLSIDDQDAITFIKNHPEIPKETTVEFVVVKSYKEQRDQAKTKNYHIEKNVREILSKTIKNQGERIYAKHSCVVGLGIGNMDCNGQITPCIIIYCLDKDLVPFGEEPLPKTLEGFHCDIREDFIMFGACFDCHEIAHPNPGCCIGLPSNGIGSAGFLAKTNESGLETSGFLTAAHVAAENWTDLYYNKVLLSELEIDQYNYEIVHCPLLPNDNSSQIIGKVRESYCGNWGPEDIGIDAAFVQNYDQDKAAYRELQPADESELDYGDQLIVLKRGGTTGKTFGRLLDGSHSPCVNPRLDDVAWRLGGFYFFDGCFAVEDISGPFFNLGDSGSGVFLTENENPTKPLGIAFAKLDNEPITFVCRIDQVAKAFKLRLYETVETMEI